MPTIDNHERTYRDYAGDHRNPTLPARAPRTQLQGIRDKRLHRETVARTRHRGAQQSAGDRRGRPDPRRTAGAAHRTARRHRRPAHPGGHRSAVLIRQRRRDARLRPRPAHVVHARCRVLARQAPQAHQGLHQTAVPARRGTWPRREGHGRRGTARRRISRHRRAQQPELRARTDRRRPRTDDGRLREIPCNPARHRLPCRLSAQGHRPDRGARHHGPRIADHREP